jgi:hypothetical protein
MKMMLKTEQYEINLLFKAHKLSIARRKLDIVITELLYFK